VRSDERTAPIKILKSTGIELQSFQENNYKNQSRNQIGRVAQRRDVTTPRNAGGGRGVKRGNYALRNMSGMYGQWKIIGYISSGLVKCQPKRKNLSRM
jgi:hypothetical protein